MTENWLCALTGHRDLPANFNDNLLYDQLEELILNGCGGFLCGMAKGFDIRALACLVDLKRKHRFTIEACIPYRGHEKSNPPAFIRYYRDLLQWCDKVTVLSDAYYSGVYLARDRYMVENADAVFAYLKKSTGGTAYTVNFARKNGKPVYFMQ